MRVDAGAFGLLRHSGVIDFLLREPRAARFLAVPLGVLAGNVLVPELAFERQARPLVSHIVVAVGHHRHRVDIGALPDHMDMLRRPCFSCFVHDRAGLAAEAKLFFETVNGDFPLISAVIV